MTLNLSWTLVRETQWFISERSANSGRAQMPEILQIMLFRSDSHLQWHFWTRCGICLWAFRQQRKDTVVGFWGDAQPDRESHAKWNTAFCQGMGHSSTMNMTNNKYYYQYGKSINNFCLNFTLFLIPLNSITIHMTIANKERQEVIWVPNHNKLGLDQVVFNHQLSTIFWISVTLFQHEGQ